MMLNRALLWFIILWGGGVALLTLGELIYRVSSAPSFWEGWTQFADFAGPFNLRYYASRAILLVPPVAAYIWRQHRMGREY
jgi:hypothetical protein